MKIKTLLTSLVLLISYNSVYTQDAKEIVRKAYEKTNGKTSKSIMSMTIVRPSWSRTVEFKSWTKGTDYAMVYIMSPAKEKGQVFLKRQKEMWNWVPSIKRLIKLPPSMMSQSWMGSDFTNDDLVNQSSIISDYNHKIIGSENIDGYDCYKIELIPHDDAAIVWGKIITWISKKDFNTLKNEYYDEDMILVQTEEASNIKQMGGKTIPTKFTITPVNKKGHKTILEFKSIEFDIPIEDEFFSQQNMKKIN
ncbi:MAG: outer membrane lipoprotein-sorting protein [Marinilabiliales bacterium]